VTFRSRGPAGLPRSRVVLPVLVWRLRPLWLAAGLPGQPDHAAGGAGFLCVEPMYVEAPSGAGAYPVLHKVLVSYGGTVGYAGTVQGALDDAQRAAAAK